MLRWIRLSFAMSLVLSFALGFSGVTDISYGSEPAGNAERAVKSVPQPNKLFHQLNCSRTDRATGCAVPYRQCDLGGGDLDIVSACQLSASNQRCPDFSWEKCCATNCYLRGGNKCMDECNAATEATAFSPDAVKYMKNKSR